MADYEVYIVKHEKIIVYVGEGKTNRHVHALSGTSHVYGLNKLHFQGANVTVEVIPKDSKKEAEAEESRLILLHQPRFNGRGFKNNGSDKKVKDHCELILSKRGSSHFNMNYCLISAMALNYSNESFMFNRHILKRGYEIYGGGSTLKANHHHTIYRTFERFEKGTLFKGSPIKFVRSIGKQEVDGQMYCEMFIDRDAFLETLPAYFKTP